MKWLEIAWAEEGVEEVGGAAANPTILGYFREVGRGDITSDEVSWCAAFVGACLARAGIRDGLTDAERLMARSFLKVGTAIDRPRVGAIAVFWRGSPEAWTGHVMFVTGWTDTHIKGIGGNQRNSVCEASYPRSQLLELRWPEVVTPDEVAKQGSRIATAASQQRKDGTKATGVELVELMTDSAGLKEVAAKAADLQASWGTIEQFLLFAVSKGKWVAGALALYWLARMLWRAGLIRHWRAEDASTGKTT